MEEAEYDCNMGREGGRGKRLLSLNEGADIQDKI